MWAPWDAGEYIIRGRSSPYNLGFLHGEYRNDDCDDGGHMLGWSVVYAG